MCCFNSALFLTFITITAISVSSIASEESPSPQLDGSSKALQNSILWPEFRLKRKSPLSLIELKGQLELAKVNGLKRRFKRFSCWHSCFSLFHKRFSSNSMKPAKKKGEQEKTQDQDSERHRRRLQKDDEDNIAENRSGSLYYEDFVEEEPSPNKKHNLAGNYQNVQSAMLQNFVDYADDAIDHIEIRKRAGLPQNNANEGLMMQSSVDEDGL